MNEEKAPDAGPPPRQHPEGHRRRRTIAWFAVAALLVMLGLTLRWAMQPSQVADLILDQVGDALGLEITASGINEYRIGDTPRLVVRDLVARQPGAPTPLLRAERVSLSLPWSTLLARGADLTVQRVEIDAPRLDLAALQRWRATRPPSKELRIPTLTEGLRIERGVVIGDSWSLDRIALTLPSLYPRQPVRAHLRGRFNNGDTRVPFDLHIALTRPAPGAGFGAVGTATVRTEGWRMPMTLQLSGRLRDTAEGVGLDDFRYGARARYATGDTELPLVFGVAGPLRYRDGRFSIAPMGVVLHGAEARDDDARGEMIPTLSAQGALAWQDALALRLDGTLAGWPDGWPALPPPIGKSGAPLPFVLDYAGPANLSGVTELQLSREATVFESRFRLPQVLEWLDTLATGTPLPPLDGRLTTPRLEIAGATLEGVHIEIADGESPGDSAP